MREKKCLRIGIPRALMYYKYFPYWLTFIKETGMEPVVSEKTSYVNLSRGVEECVDDVCVALKAFYGHVLRFPEKVDCLMIPRLISVEKRKYDTFTCPKLIGLPDMITGFDECIPKTVEFVLDVARTPAWKSAVDFAAKLGVGRREALRADIKASRAQKNAELEALKGKKIDDIEKRFLNGSDDDEQVPDSENTEQIYWWRKNGSPAVALIGHPYLIYDPFLSSDALRFIENHGLSVVTPAGMPADSIEEEASKYADISWSYERELIGAASLAFNDPFIDGIVMIESFACGPDSIITEIINREIRGKFSPDKPMMTMVIDEHTGRAGVHTRLEAFIDMMLRKNLRK